MGKTTGGEIDYAALFAARPSPCVVMTADMVISDVNQAFLRVMGRTRDELIGSEIMEVLPADPDGPRSHGMRALEASVERVLATGERDVLPPVRFDIPVAGEPGRYEERYWSTVNSPIFGPDGRPVRVVVRVEDVTAVLRGEPSGGDLAHERSQEIETELYARAGRPRMPGEWPRRARAREREIALTLQPALLPPEDFAHPPHMAVRYRPAVGSPNVCGDWYELAELGKDRIAVAVGDVVGHGVGAAGVMGRLRGALSVAIRTLGDPALALDVLGLCARSIEDALATTAVQTVIDRRTRLIAYSCAGHLPPLLLQPGGLLVSLDQATDPPLGVRPQPERRPQAHVTYAPGATLVLYTDGLVERRGEDIDAGLHRLTGSLTRNRSLAPEPLADAILADLGVGGGAEDDITLVVVRL